MRRRLIWMVFILAACLPARADDKPSDVAYDDLNSIFGLSLWSSDDLWSEPAAATAARLKWPRESKTADDSSYRLYTRPTVQVLGEHPYSLALYGDADGNVAYLSLMFANEGDVQDLMQQDGVKSYEELMAKPTEKNLLATKVKALIDQEVKSIQARVTGLLGKPKITSFGQDASSTESVLRWDWNGHSILLASENGKYLAVRILPTAVADQKNAKRITQESIGKKLQGQVTHRDNGDVVIQNIPMVDQGPKGYCLPATWERDLRYMGIPADMYMLAMLGSTGIGGATSTGKMVQGVGNMVRNYGLRIFRQTGNMQILNFADKIDHGIPVMWGMFVVDKLNAELTKRSKARTANTTPADWTAYKKTLMAARTASYGYKNIQDNGHMCMIIGYNLKTGEIAISDSWGAAFTERWITVEEAQAITQGELYEVTF